MEVNSCIIEPGANLRGKKLTEAQLTNAKLAGGSILCLRSRLPDSRTSVFYGL